MENLRDLKRELKSHERPNDARGLQRFFKTGPGEYAEGDIFLGLKTAETRSIAQKYQELSLADLEELLHSKIHEERSVAVMILNRRFQKADLRRKGKIYNFYLKNLSGINNWDLVDISAPIIVGSYLGLSGTSREILYQLAKSEDLWERRIAIMATYHFIKNGEFRETLEITKILLNDKEGLIHKAVGWMLREIGNRNRAVEERFLQKYYRKMPRTMLRYAIEKFPERKRQAYLKARI